MNKIEKTKMVLELYADGLLPPITTIEKIKRVMESSIEEVEAPIKVDKRRPLLTHKSHKYKRFTEEENQYIKDNIGKKSVSQIAKDLKKPYSSVFNKTQNREKSIKVEAKKEKLPEEEELLIRGELMKGTSQETIAERLGITVPILKEKIRQIHGFKN